MCKTVRIICLILLSAIGDMGREREREYGWEESEMNLHRIFTEWLYRISEKLYSSLTFILFISMTVEIAVAHVELRG